MLWPTNPTRAAKVAFVITILMLITSRAGHTQDGSRCAQLLFQPNLDRTPIIAPLDVYELWDSFMFMGEPGSVLMENWPNNWDSRFVRLWDPFLVDWEEEDGPPPDSFGYGQRRIVLSVSRWEFDASCGALPNSAGIAGRAHDITINPGQKVRVWHNVKNVGLNTWSQTEGYGWKGIHEWGGRSGPIWRPIAPGESIMFEEEITAPDTPGRYYYGFILNQNGQNFGPIYFTRVTVRSFTELEIIKGVPWANKCTGSLSACLPIKLSVDDLREEWQPVAKAAADMWTSVGTRLRIVPQHINEELRVLVPVGSEECNYQRPFIDSQTGQELKVATGEVRIVPMSRVIVENCGSWGGIGIPYAHPDNASKPIAGLVLINDQLPPWVHWRWRIPLYWGAGLDLQTVIAHEIGHTLGICGHDQTPGCDAVADTSEDAVMHSYSKSQQELIAVGLPRRNIHADDIPLLTSLYGEIVSGLQPARTSLISPSWLTPFGFSGTPATTATNLPTFYWNHASGDPQYIFQLSDTRSFDNLLISTSTSEPSLDLPTIAAVGSVLQPFQTYYWRVQSTNSYGNSEWSIPWELRTSTQSCGMSLDATCDGQVSLADFEVWRQEYLGFLPSLLADFDQDGVVDLADYTAWLIRYDTDSESFIPQPNQLARPAIGSFATSQVTLGDDDTVKAEIYLETNADAKVSIASIAVRYPIDLLELIESRPCETASSAAISTIDLPDVTRMSSDQSEYEVLKIVGTPGLMNGNLPSGRFCFVSVVFRTTQNFAYPLSADITLDASVPWEIIGEQTDFFAVLNTPDIKLEVTLAPSVADPYIVQLQTTFAQCVLRRSQDAAEQQLTIDGQNMLLAPHHLQFRRIDTFEESIHFAAEVNWQNDNSISVDFAQITQHLWDVDAVELQVRLTNQDYAAVSNWSSPFWLVDDQYLCPDQETDKPTQILMPLLARPVE